MLPVTSVFIGFLMQLGSKKTIAFPPARFFLGCSCLEHWFSATTSVAFRDSIVRAEVN
jgi:hypothetical protein